MVVQNYIEVEIVGKGINSLYQINGNNMLVDYDLNFLDDLNKDILN